MTETERKNLEDAAKAIGLRYDQDADRWFNDDGIDWAFDPITNAADLIMLMKGCNMWVDFGAHLVCVGNEMCLLWPEGWPGIYPHEPTFEHAVVRAAAEYWRARNDTN